MPFFKVKLNPIFSFLFCASFFFTSFSFAQQSTFNFFVKGISTMNLDVFINNEHVKTIENNTHLECILDKTGSYNFVFKLRGSNTELIKVNFNEHKDFYYVMRGLSYSFKEVDKKDWTKTEDKIDKVESIYYTPQEKVANNGNVKNAPTPNFSLLRFYSKSHFNGTNIFELFLNDRSVGNIRKNEVLSCKLYSEGRIKVSYIIGNFRKTDIIDVKNGYDQNYVLNKYNGELDKLSLSDWKSIIGKSARDTVLYEENKQNPFGELKAKKSASQGSGFLLNNQGYVITNFHVIEDAEEIKIRGVKNDYNTSFNAIVVAVDAVTDLALLKINSSLIQFDTPPYAFRSSKQVKQGEEIFTLGYPIQKLMGMEIKVTDGIINSKSGYKGGISEFQFSAIVQPGNSGGPLIDSEGNIVGVVTSKLNRQLAENANYAIKSDYLSFFLNQVEDFKFESGSISTTKLDISNLVEKYSQFVYIIETK